MFGEAFWFMYLVGLVGSVASTAVAIAIAGSVVTMLVFVIAAVEESTKLLRVAKRRLLPIVLVAAIIAVFIPQPVALYAGAGQYVVESTELDDTLLNLKKLIDDKIKEHTTQ